MMKSISLVVVPALSIAILAASTPMVVVVSSVRCAYLLSLMPVRSWIHSSLVSMYFFRSSLVKMFSGTYIPIPAILLFTMQQSFNGPANYRIVKELKPFHLQQNSGSLIIQVEKRMAVEWWKEG